MWRADGQDDRLTYDNFLPRFLEKVPDLQPLYDAHIRELDEILPYILLPRIGEFIYYLYGEIEKHGEESEHFQQVLMQILDMLETAAQISDVDLGSLIYLGFVESFMPGTPEEARMYPEIKKLVGHTLRAELRQEEKQRPDLFPPVPKERKKRSPKSESSL
jgi:hypothetical protein